MTEGRQKIGGQAPKHKTFKKAVFLRKLSVGLRRTVASVIDPALEETGGPEYETLGMMGSIV